MCALVMLWMKWCDGCLYGKPNSYPPALVGSWSAGTPVAEGIMTKSSLSSLMLMRLTCC